MLSEIRREVNSWKYRESACEPTTLKGIKRLIRLNSSHPIIDGTSLVYFIEKENSTQDTAYFGSKQVQWLYHCCIGFKDLYRVWDWLIDLSYHFMTGENKRIIDRDEYLANIPCTVDTTIIPLPNLEYFLCAFNLECEAPRTLRLMFVLDPIYRSEVDSEIIDSMLNRSLIIRYRNLTNFFLPILD